MIYPAHARYVKSPNCVESDIHLGFDISIHKSLLIKNLNMSLFPDKESQDKATHCLIVLIGSKKVWVRPSGVVQNFQTADFYIGGIKFSPVGYVTIEDQLTVDVCAFMKWLAKDGLDSHKVIGAINGQPQTPSRID